MSDTQTEAQEVAGRMARCTYYGTVPNGRGTPFEQRGKPCTSEEPSAKNDEGRLAFFKAHPEKDHDEFYCGCWGWD